MVTGMMLVAAAIALAPQRADPRPCRSGWSRSPGRSAATAWALVIASTSVLLLKLSAPEEAGSNSAALQISDASRNVLLLAVGGAAFAALGGGAVGALAPRRHRRSHPVAFAAVFLPMARVALAGAWVATRLRDRHEKWYRCDPLLEAFPISQELRALTE